MCLLKEVKIFSSEKIKKNYDNNNNSSKLKKLFNKNETSNKNN